MPATGSTAPGSTSASGTTEYERAYRGLFDALLCAEALAIGRIAARITGSPIPEVAAAVMAARPPLRTGDPLRAARAAIRAGSRAARRRGRLDTCLTRALVTAGLIVRRRTVTLHVGFRPASQEPPVDGHAWLTVDGTRIELAPPPALAENPYVQALEIPMSVSGATRGRD